MYAFAGRPDAEEFRDASRRAYVVYSAEFSGSYDRYDMRLYEAASIDASLPFETLVAGAEAVARRYFSGAASSEPVWELLSEHALIVRGQAEGDA